jgi:hypothetical protein
MLDPRSLGGPAAQRFSGVAMFQRRWHRSKSLSKKGLLAIMDWKPIDTAPFYREVEVAVIDGQGAHTLIFPRRRIVGGWIDAQTKKQLYYILLTH